MVRRCRRNGLKAHPTIIFLRLQVRRFAEHEHDEAGRVTRNEILGHHHPAVNIDNLSGNVFC